MKLKEKYIALFAFLLPIMGILNEQFFGRIFGRIYGFLSCVNLNIFHISLDSYFLLREWGVPSLNVVFYISLLIGAILYILSKHKETRLLRFGFAIILYSNILMFPIHIIRIVTNFTDIINLPNTTIALVVLHLLARILYAFFAYFCLKQLNETKTLLRKKGEDSFETEHFVAVKKSRRFFHFIVDNIFSSALAIPVIIFLTIIFNVFDFERNMSDDYFFYIYLIIARLLYTWFFEYFFHATPAKFFTESRVIGTTADVKLSSSKIFVRTISRFVPFEPFSFLGAGTGWHDKWTSTAVVEEEQTGRNVSRYWWLLIFIVTLFASIHFIGKAIEERQRYIESYIESRNRHEHRISELRNAIDNVSEGTVFRLGDINRSFGRFGNDAWYIVAEEITDTGIVFATVFGWFSTIMDIKMKLEDDIFDRITITKQQLHQAYTVDYDDFRRDRRRGVQLIESEPKMEITKAMHLTAPNLTARGTGSIRGVDISIHIENRGENVKLLSIENTDGRSEWTLRGDSLINDRRRQNTFVGTLQKGNDDYEFHFTVQTNNGNTYRYKVRGRELSYQLIRIWE